MHVSNCQPHNIWTGKNVILLKGFVVIMNDMYMN